MKETSITVRKMEQVFLDGQMVIITMENIKMINNMGSALLFIMMVTSM